MICILFVGADPPGDQELLQERGRDEQRRDQVGGPSTDCHQQQQKGQ